MAGTSSPSVVELILVMNICSDKIVKHEKNYFEP